MEIVKTDYLGHIPEPPVVKFLPQRGYEEVEKLYELHQDGKLTDSFKDCYVGCRDGNLCEITNPVFEGVNPSNLKDTTRVKIKSFTWNGHYDYEATYEEVEWANRDYRDEVLRLYKFHAQFDPNVYTKSLGILPAGERLQRLVRSLDLDLEMVQLTLDDTSMVYEPGSPEFNKEVCLCLDLENTLVLNNIINLIKQVQEEAAEIHRTTYEANALTVGHSQQAEATNNVAAATLEQAEATLMSGEMIAESLQDMAVESFRANKIARGWGGSLGLAHMANAQGY